MSTNIKNQIRGAQINEEGFLIDSSQWNELIAKEIAYKENINKLNDKQLELLYFAREFFNKFGQSPNMKALVKFVKTKRIEMSSIEVMNLFPLPSGQLHHIKIICKIAGLPRPFGCK